MKDQLKFTKITAYHTDQGKVYKNLEVSYEILGEPIGESPIVMVNHALTGNSDVASKKYGWWRTIIGEEKLIDTKRFTVISFNIPGNGYDGLEIEKYTDFTSRDIAKIFIEALQQLKIEKLYAVIGGSLGGGIAWEMAVLSPNLMKYLIPVASDWKSSDWIIGHNYIQNKLLENSSKPLQDARMMAMLFYRTPASFGKKFDRTKTDDQSMFNVNSWLQHHGNKLENRFKLEAYQLMNHLLTCIDITSHKDSFEAAVKPIQSEIIQIAIDSDLFFVPEENFKTKEKLDKLDIPNHYFVVNSLHGHDGFLIESKQITKILTPFFKIENTK